MVKKIKLPCGREAIVDEWFYRKHGHKKWYASKNGYVQFGRMRNGKRHRFYMHRLVTKCPRNLVVDHLNKNKLDNRISNLMPCENKTNTHGIKRKKSKSIFNGVTIRDNFYTYYEARIRHDGKNYSSKFVDEISAAIQHDIWAIKFYGIHAKTNFLPPMSSHVVINCIGLNFRTEDKRFKANASKV